MFFLLCEPKNCWKEGFFLIAINFNIPASIFGKDKLHSIAKVIVSEALSVASDHNLFSRVQNFLQRINFNVDMRMSIVLIIQILKQLSLFQQHSAIQLTFFKVGFAICFKVSSLF